MKFRMNVKADLQATIDTIEVEIPLTTGNYKDVGPEFLFDTARSEANRWARENGFTLTSVRSVFNDGKTYTATYNCIPLFKEDTVERSSVKPKYYNPLFSDYSEARKILHYLKVEMAFEKKVSVAYLKDLTQGSHIQTDEEWGWASLPLSEVEIVAADGGGSYFIRLPEPIRLFPEKEGELPDPTCGLEELIRQDLTDYFEEGTHDQDDALWGIYWKMMNALTNLRAVIRSKVKE